jgi:TrmH family RNA methyltransferase
MSAEHMDSDSIESMRRVRVVLVRPQVAGNVGAVARLMENFNAGQLCLVEPKAGALSREAVQRSTHGEHRLQSAKVVPTLTEALEGVVYAVGASRRRGPVHQADDLTPPAMARVLSERATDGNVALLFGTEDNGLSREDLLSCDAVVNIPANPEYATLNLSHAVAICLYEVFMAMTGAPASKSHPKRRRDPADLALVNRLTAKLQHALLTIGYLHPEKPDHLMFPIRNILSRVNLTRAEAQILIGLAQQIDEFAQYGKPES